MVAPRHEPHEKLTVGCVVEYACKPHLPWYVDVVVVVGLHSHEN